MSAPTDDRVAPLAFAAAPLAKPWRSPLHLASIVGSFVRRDWHIARSYRLGFFTDLLSLVVSLGMFFYIAKLVDTSTLEAVSDLPAGYFPFVVIGLSVLRLGQSTFSSFSSKLRREQGTGTLEALLATPPPPWVVITASAAYEVLYAAISAVVMISIGAAMGMDLTLGVATAIVLLVAVPGLVVLCAAAGIVIAAATLLFKQTSTIQSIGTSFLGLLGGVYFPIEVLPAPVEALARAVPITWGVDALRRGLLDGQVAVAQTVGLVVSAVLLAPLSLWVFRLAVDRARRTGGIGQY